MVTFIDEVTQQLLQKHKDLSDLSLIFPSRRAGVFFKKSLKKHLQGVDSFLPQILSIEELIEQMSGLFSPGQTHLQVMLYEVYSDRESAPENFLEFLGWSNTLLSDFNEIDRYLLDRESFFDYLTAVKKLNAWNIEEGNSTDFVNQYLSFWQSIKEYYYLFNKKLEEQGMGYQGMLYRKAAEHTQTFIDSVSNKYVFVGFNALNAAEQHIIQRFLESGKAEIFWEIDQYFYNDEQLALSRFIRGYFKTWNFYKNNPIPQLPEHFNEEKNFTTIAVPQQIGQVKYIGKLLESFSPEGLSKTAIVLGDEALLLPLLNSLPSTVENLNVTMGLPLAQVPDSAFFDSWIAMHLNSKENEFFHKNILAFLSQEHTATLLENKATEIKETINQENLIYVSYDILAKIVDDKATLELLFKPWNDSPAKALDILLNGISILHNKLIESKDPLRIEYLNGFQEIFHQLKQLLSANSHITDIRTLYYFYQDILRNETLDLRGDPYTGLQIMGVLESRVLDFETVIITSLNEGTLPAGKSQNSFIPFDMKREFNLPTYREKDAIYAYHFFRLLQRAKTAYFLYNNVSDGLDRGEKSRFLLQLETDANAKYKYKEVTASAEVKIQPSQLKVIAKTPEIIAKLLERAARGFSPSGLSTYIRNPIDFYNRYVLGIKELEEVEDTVAFNTLGTVVHNALENLYTPFKNTILTTAIIEQIEKKIDDEVSAQFAEEYSSENIKQGMNLIIYNVALQFVRNFIAMEKDLVTAGNEIVILDLEAEYMIPLNIPEKNVKLGGKVDRIDRINGQLRIMDYKTGRVQGTNLKVKDWELLFDDYDKYSKPFQVLCYALMMKRSGKYNEDFLAGIISFKNLKEGFLSFEYEREKIISEEVLTQFENDISALILEILSPEKPFKEKEIPVKNW